MYTFTFMRIPRHHHHRHACTEKQTQTVKIIADWAVVLVWGLDRSLFTERNGDLISVIHLMKGVGGFFCFFFLVRVFTVALRIRNQMNLTFLPMSYKQFKMGKGGVKQTEQMLWNGKSDHFTSHLFCLPIYCCKARVQRSRCLAKHEGAVPLSLWGWFSLLSLLMHRHDSCLISWSC